MAAVELERPDQSLDIFGRWSQQGLLTDWPRVVRERRVENNSKLIQDEMRSYVKASSGHIVSADYLI